MKLGYFFLTIVCKITLTLISPLRKMSEFGESDQQAVYFALLFPDGSQHEMISKCKKLLTSAPCQIFLQKLDLIVVYEAFILQNSEAVNSCLIHRNGKYFFVSNSASVPCNTIPLPTCICLNFFHFSRMSDCSSLNVCQCSFHYVYGSTKWQQMHQLGLCFAVCFFNLRCNCAKGGMTQYTP